MNRMFALAMLAALTARVVSRDLISPPSCANNVCYNTCVSAIPETNQTACPSASQTASCACGQKKWRCSKLCQCFSAKECTAASTMDCQLECDDALRTVNLGYYFPTCPLSTSAQTSAGCYNDCIYSAGVLLDGTTLCHPANECSCSLQSIRCVKKCNCFKVDVCAVFAVKSPSCALDCFSSVQGVREVPPVPASPQNAVPSPGSNTGLIVGLVFGLGGLIVMLVIIFAAVWWVAVKRPREAAADGQSVSGFGDISGFGEPLPSQMRNM